MTNLLEPRSTYKPLVYPWALEVWKSHEQMHWIADETPLADDVKDWQKNLNEAEKNLLTQIFRFFTQSDIEVADCYNKKYATVFKAPEVSMMLSGFAARENIHIAAYSHLLDTVGMPEVEYSAFLKYKEMADKVDYMHGFNVDSKRDIARTLAAFGCFTEGVQLFASFAILMNFPRFNKMKGMAQIVTWSIRDEEAHVQGITKLFRTFIQENPELWDEELKEEIRQIARDIIEREDAFIDLAFEMGEVEGLKAKEVKKYIRYIADRRLIEIGLKGIFHVRKNPLPWLDEMLNAVEHANFFETRSTEYSRAATEGSWDEAFAN